MLLLVNIKKELLLLSRDRGGLLVLFVMPMLLVLVLSLIQDNLFRATGETATRALFVNLDEGDLGAEFAASIKATGAIELIAEISGEPLDTQTARQKVFSGDYQFAIVVPVEFSAAINTAAEATVRAALRNEEAVLTSGPLRVFFDPTVRGVYRTAVSNALQRGCSVWKYPAKVKPLGGCCKKSYRLILRSSSAASALVIFRRWCRRFRPIGADSH